MKNIFKITVGMVLCLALSACSKHFLDEKSQDEVRPSTVSDLQELLMGEVYPAGSSESSFQIYLDAMTDDMTSNLNTDPSALSYYNQYAGPYTWQSDMYETMQAAAIPDDIDTYAHYYRCIKGCNAVLDMIDNVRGDSSSRENVRGQALAMRAYFYFMLVNLYGQPYNAKGVDITSSPGVELILSSVVHDTYPSREPVARIYQQVEGDLLKAQPLIEKYGQSNSKFRVTDMFIYTLLSRMYLYQEKWSLSQQYATLGLNRNPRLVNLASIPYPDDYSFPATGVYSINSPEAIWLGYGNWLENRNFTLGPATGPRMFSISPDLQSKYDFNRTNTNNRGDLRMRYFYYWWFTDDAWTIFVPWVGQKTDQTAESTNGPVKGMRVAELYLNRAESYIQQYLKNGDGSLRAAALADLNFLRSNRYDTRNVAYTNVDYSGQALLDFCRDERRRELNFEDHRWFDLRRYGMPELHHTLQMTASQAPVDYVLHQGDKRYVLPIPRSALLLDPNLQPNP
jgi:hypothetical protein